MLAEGAGLVARAANFQANQIVIEVRDVLGIGDLAAEVARAKNSAGWHGRSRRRIESRPG